MKMKLSPAAIKKRAKLVARQLKAGCESVVRKYQKPAVS